MIFVTKSDIKRIFKEKKIKNQKFLFSYRLVVEYLNI